MRVALRLAVPLLTIAALASCSETPAVDKLCTTLALEDDVSFEAQSLGVAHAEGILALAGTLDGRDAYCSAFLVGPSMALTAAHCEPLTLAPDVYAFTAGAAAQVVATLLHPSLDVMLVELSWEAGTATPAIVPISVQPLSESIIGRGAVAAGYGRTDRYQASVLHYSAQRVSSLEDSRIGVLSLGSSGVCSGDSGGPLFTRGLDGHLEAIGVLSTSSSSCAGSGHYTRIDVLASWLEQEQVLPQATLPVGCDGLDFQGSCDEGRALWCQDGALLASSCAAACGWSEAMSGYRCLAEPDPCAGLQREGKCTSTVASRCVEGSIESVDCSRCGAACVIDSGSRLAGCQAPAPL